MKKFLILSLVLIISFVFYASSSSSNLDFGEPDTVKFGEWCGYVVGPPYSGKLAIPVIFFSDSYIGSFGIPLGWTGPILLDTAYFIGFRVDSTDFTSVLIDNENKKVCMGWVDFHDWIPPGRGPMLSLNFNIMDTGLVSIDTSTWEYGLCEFFFSDPMAYKWTPQFIKAEFEIIPSDILPGDLNFDGEIDLADAIFLANYILKGGEPPECFLFADVNCDCEIDLVDVIYLARYCFGVGPDPLLGCAW